LDGDESSRSSSSSSSSALSETVDDDNRSSRAQQQFETRPDSVQPFSNVTTTTTTITPSATRFLATAVAGPTLESKPDYENMVGPLGRRMDRLFCTLFRRELAAQVGGADSTLEADDYQGIIELAARMNREIPHREEIQQRAQTVLRNLFPSWMPVRLIGRCANSFTHSYTSLCMFTCYRDLMPSSFPNPFLPFHPE
jgi:hypothetical protein